MSTPTHEPSCCSPQHQKWYTKKAWWLVIAVLFVGFISQWIPLLKPFAAAFWGYLNIMAWAVAAGLLIGGLVDHYIPKEYISRLLARPKKRTVLYATGLGLLASACSHGVLALSMELHKKGASGPAVISFLLASPWSNFPVTLLLIGLFGWRGILIILAALLVALTTGLIFQWLDRMNWIEKNKNTSSLDSAFDLKEDFKKRFRAYRFSFSQLQEDLAGIGKGIAGLSEMILGWVILGIFLASLAQAYIPSHFFEVYMGANFLGLLLTLVFATVLEVCSEGTAPLAFEIYRQTHALGNSFVFLSAGVITDFTEIGLVWSNLGRKTALWMVLIGVPQILILGFLLNLFF